jgi:predicted nuclease of restriction endonuclease-like (RecB) superfamily
LGDDFAFVGRRRRLRLDDTCLRVDLLFFAIGAGEVVNRQIAQSGGR